MVATGSLVASVIGPSKDISSPYLRGSTKFHRKIVTDKSLEISTTLPYAPYANEQRPFTEYSDKFWKQIGDELTNEMGFK